MTRFELDFQLDLEASGIPPWIRFLEIGDPQIPRFIIMFPFNIIIWIITINDLTSTVFFTFFGQNYVCRQVVPSVQGWNIHKVSLFNWKCLKICNCNHLSWIARQFLQASICFRRAAQAGHRIAEYWRPAVVPSWPGIVFDFQCN